MYGAWIKDFESTISPIVQGRKVWDIGCGHNAPHAPIIARMGASSIIMLDKDPVRVSIPIEHEFLEARFEELSQSMPVTVGDDDLAFLSWPINHRCWITELVTLFNTVIVVTCTTDGTRCGSTDLWHHFTRRELLAHVPGRRNSLPAYGRLGITRKPILEEQAGIDTSRIYAFE